MADKLEIKNKIESFFSDGVTKLYSEGSIIVMNGQEPKSIMYLTEGVVEQYDITHDGNKVTINMFKPGAFFPMSWAINKTPNKYFFSASTDVTIKSVKSDLAVEFIRSNPDVLFDLLARVYSGTDAILRRLVLASSGVASDRLIYELLIESYRFGTKINDTTIMIKVKRTSLSERCGLARETISRELHKLEADGLIKLSRQGIELNIIDMQERIDFGS